MPNENLVEKVEKKEYGLGYTPLVLCVRLDVCNLIEFSDILQDEVKASHL